MMHKQFIKKLAQASYKDIELDQKAVDRIVAHLSKLELKVYIKELKYIEKSNTIMFEVPRDNTALENQLRDVFPGKKVQVTVNPALLLGMRVQDNDDVYEMSLKNTLNSMTDYITE